MSSTARGERARAAADPVHAEAVQRYFGSRLTAAQRDALAALAKSWAGSTGDAHAAP